MGLGDNSSENDIADITLASRSIGDRVSSRSFLLKLYLWLDVECNPDAWLLIEASHL